MAKAPSLPGSSTESEIEECCDEYVGTRGGLFQDQQIIVCPTCDQKLLITVRAGYALPTKWNEPPKTRA